MENGETARHVNVLREDVEVGQHFGFAGAVIIRKDADDFESAPAKFEIAPNREKGISCRELSAYQHLGGAMLKPAPAFDSQLAVNLVGDGIDTAQKGSESVCARLISRRIETGDYFGRHQCLAIRGGGDLGVALDDLVLVARDVAATLIGGAAAEHDPVIAEGTFQNRGAQSRDKP